MLKHKPTPGNCYYDSFMIFTGLELEDGETTVHLVHGYPRLTKADQEGNPEGSLFGHAWLEKTKPSEIPGWDSVSVFDIYVEEYIPKKVYYKVGRVSENFVRRYTLPEAYSLVGTHENAGPWEDAPAEAVFSKSNPKHEEQV